VIRHLLPIPAVLLVAGVLAVTGAQADSTPAPVGYAKDAPRVVPAAKLVKAVGQRERWRARAVRAEQVLRSSPDAETSLQIAGIVYGQSWTAMRSCWLSEGYRNGERYQRRIVRYNRAGSGAAGPAQFMPGTWAGTPFGRFDIHNVFAQAMATGWMWQRDRRGEWAGAGC